MLISKWTGKTFQCKLYKVSSEENSEYGLMLTFLLKKTHGPYTYRIWI